MSDYTLALAKRDFENGFLLRFTIERGLYQNDGEWCIRLGHQFRTGFLVDQRTKKIRYFKSLDGVVATLEKIGFRVDGLGLLSR